ncbi:hypothetical protein ACFL2Q_03520, partial [Thermodesulfobacteriota bacterium]
FTHRLGTELSEEIRKSLVMKMRNNHGFSLKPIAVLMWRTNVPHARHVDPKWNSIKGVRKPSCLQSRITYP